MLARQSELRRRQRKQAGHRVHAAQRVGVAAGRDAQQVLRLAAKLAEIGSGG